MQGWAVLPSILWLKFPASFYFLIKTSFLVDSQEDLWSKIRTSGTEVGTGQGSHFGGHCSLLETEKQGRKAQGSWGQESICPSYILAFISQCPHTGLLDSFHLLKEKKLKKTLKLKPKWSPPHSRQLYGHNCQWYPSLGLSALFSMPPPSSSHVPAGAKSNLQIYPSLGLSWDVPWDLIFLGSKITADGNFSPIVTRCFLLGRKAMTNLESILKSRDMTLPTKVHLIKAMVFPVVMYGCESWTMKKAERWRIDAFELWCWRRLLRAPWTARRSNQSILKEISPEYSLKGLMLKLKFPYFCHLMWRTDSLGKTLMLGKIEDGRRRGRQRMR